MCLVTCPFNQYITCFNVTNTTIGSKKYHPTKHTLAHARLWTCKHEWDALILVVASNQLKIKFSSAHNGGKKQSGTPNRIYTAVAFVFAVENIIFLGHHLWYFDSNYCKLEIFLLMWWFSAKHCFESGEVFISHCPNYIHILIKICSKYSLSSLFFS